MVNAGLNPKERANETNVHPCGRAGRRRGPSGCGSLGTQVQGNLQDCERNYNGAISAGFGGAFTGTLQIHCPAAPVKAAAAEAEETTAD